MLSESIAKLVQYGVETELIPECERNYTTNLLLDVFYEDDYTAPEQEFQNIEQLVGGSILAMTISREDIIPSQWLRHRLKSM